MNNSEVLEKLRAYLKCRGRQVKGIYYACNNKKCDDCDLCYMQGTTGEHIEAIEVATQALEKLQVYKNLEEQGRIVEVSNVDLFFLLLSVVENRFNNSVLTKYEAEEKLKELRGGENESNN